MVGLHALCKSKEIFMPLATQAVHQVYKIIKLDYYNPIG